MTCKHCGAEDDHNTDRDKAVQVFLNRYHKSGKNLHEFAALELIRQYRHGRARHGIQAFYSNLPGPRQTRILECSCGFSALALTWEESGRLMDQHIREAAEATAKERVFW